MPKAQIDENLPPALARILDALAKVGGDSVVHVRDYVSAGTKDVDLFPEAAAAGITIHITKDHHQRRPIEREVIAKTGLAVFVLAKGWNSQPLHMQAAQLIRWWPRIIEQAKLLQGGAILKVPYKGDKFEMILGSTIRKRPRRAGLASDAAR